MCVRKDKVIGLLEVWGFESYMMSANTENLGFSSDGKCSVAALSVPPTGFRGAVHIHNPSAVFTLVEKAVASLDKEIFFLLKALFVGPYETFRDRVKTIRHQGFLRRNGLSQKQFQVLLAKMWRNVTSVLDVYGMEYEHPYFRVD